MAQMQSFLLIKTWITQSQRKFLLVLFKIVIFNVDFVYEKPNSKVICEEIVFPSTFLKMPRQHFFQDFKPNYLENLRGYP